MKWNRRLRGLTMFVFNFGVESLEQSVKLGRLVILISLAIPFSTHHFFQTDNRKAVLFTVFLLLELFFSYCIVVGVLKENLLKTQAIVSLANFQHIQMLRHPRLTFDWLSVSFFGYWPVRMSSSLLSSSSSSLNNLKTAFILSNQNWVIFSCIFLSDITSQVNAKSFQNSTQSFSKLFISIYLIFRNMILQTKLFCRKFGFT